ncbi:hypothetical protein MNV49_000251, partial [Pseudohyphozyma bogoriensis]
MEDTDLHDSPIEAPQPPTPSPFSFKLDEAVFVLVQRLGLVPSTSPAVATAYDSPAIDYTTNASEQWRPLIPIHDALVLLAAVPAALRPPQLRPAPALAPSPKTRQDLLDALARLALEPSLTMEIMRRFRPLAVHLWGRWLEMLGLDASGEWSRPEGMHVDGERQGEREAVEKVYRAMVAVLSVFENVFPFLATLLRHPLMSSPPIPSPSSSAEVLATPLLTLHQLLHALPHLPSSTHTATHATLPWSFPSAIEVIMKTHPHRGTRLLAWRILRKWYALYANVGEDLREQWVWKGTGEEEGSAGPLPPFLEEYKEDYEREFGAFQGEKEAADLLPGWHFECLAQARFIEGGVEVLVREKSVDAWVLPVLEDARSRIERKNLWTIEAVPREWIDDAAREVFESSPSTVGLFSETELSCTVVNVEGYLLFREGFIPSTTYPSLPAPAGPPPVAVSSSTALQPTPEPFVRTPATELLLRSLALHVQRRLPVLITSPPSSGKTSTITHLWSILHSLPSSASPSEQARRRGLVFINLADRSLDSKSLLGSLSSAPATEDTEAGTFAFVEGPLTRAVRQGRWVVLTAIDQASVEVLSVIKVLAERMRRASEASVAGAWGGGAGEEGGGVGVRVGGGQGRWVRAGRGFMLFATRSVESRIGDRSEANFFSSHFFSEVWMERPGRLEIGLIVLGRYERLAKTGLTERMIDVWEKAREVGSKEGGAGTVRPVGVRDLMRWCRRVEGLLPRDVNITTIESNPVLQEEIFTEARDVFLGSLAVPASFTLAPDARDRYSIVAKVLAEGLGLSDERAEWVIRRRVPELVVPKVDEADGIASTADLSLKIGRVSLPYRPTSRSSSTSRPYALTKPSLIVLEKLAVSLRLSEPVLMVGETGTGKTAAVGHLAELLGKNLTALNLSNQTEAGDLVGGFRPIDEAEEARRTASHLVNRFVELFGQTFSISRNAEYVSHVKKAFEKKRWARLVSLWREAFRMATERLGTATASAPASSRPDADAPRKRRKLEALVEDLPTAWQGFLNAISEFDTRHVQKSGKSKFVFSFVEGPLAKAIRNGDWVLLDEVNLASAETLESLSTLLQAPDSSLILTEQGDLEPIPRHPDFRLFACMNPATDVGKRDLPAGLRAKFTELWVPPPDEDKDALVTIVQGYIGRSAVQDRAVILDVAELYSAVKALAIGAQLADGSNHPPHFSMRTLARALMFAAEFAPVFGLRRALFEGFLMAFTMLLDAKSNALVRTLLDQHIVAKAKNRGSLFAQMPPKPSGYESVRFGPYWLETGDEPLQEPKEYILTPSVQAKVLDLSRAILTRKVPVLIQGPTSAGKTSVVEYLAKRTGHRFVRINNHEHTDIQEYIGTYVSDSTSGKLVFQEGVLVRALRRGDWIVLDELNLAPTDVLEALNRLLDDNRELVIPETGEVVRPHPHFMLFATQNPPGLYGGRKVLSRAFRNRFLEMHFGDVPQDELETILCQRCEIAPSYAKKTVAVFLELQRRRQAGRVFEQKQAFATLRDLFRWGGRGSVGYQQLAEDGYMLLAERARRADDKAVVKEVIEQEMKVKIDETTLYDFSRLAEAGLPEPPSTAGLVWTSAMRRLYFLIASGLLRNEPVLLVGETGAGKTSVCQSLALALGRQLHVVGCHQNTETADLLGGQRPFRNRASLQAALREEAASLLSTLVNPSEDFEDVIVAIQSASSSTTDDEAKAALADLLDRMRKTTALFEWHDGPLVQAMHGGDLILLDEISLADDSVLERLNSVLEPSRTLVLAEKGGRDLEDIRVVGAEGFEILATMNPGGDFGKKELSPALRNRFTEIWVPHVDDPKDLLQIIGSRWKDDSLTPFGPKILEFGRWFADAAGASEGPGVGLRDILAWVDFLNVAAVRVKASASVAPSLTLAEAFCQGAMMTVVDGLGALPATSGFSKDALERLRGACHRQLEGLVSVSLPPPSAPVEVSDAGDHFYVGAFGVSRGSLAVAPVDYTLQAPTTRLNAMRLLRALQLTKPVLLEGSPGVGKTSLVTALAAATGHHLVRINLSDQTDLMDLLGSDLPVEGGRSGEFAWKDAPFLAAMQQGSWVLLDEMNLASQSVLEGLNSSLDHRGTVYIPELDRTFSRHPDFRIFAAQNPLGQGGGRKGLPRSFLDRFSIVHMEELNSTDLNAIACALYPDIDTPILEKMIAFNTDIHRQTMEDHSFGAEGSPWEFNLRDVLRWLSLVRSSSGLDLRQGEAIEYVGLLYLQRFRNIQDRTIVARHFAKYFGQLVDPLERPWPSVTPRLVQIGHSLIPRSDERVVGRPLSAAPLLQKSLQPLESLAKCIAMGWLAILTGPRASGKTTLVRQLAALEGRVLREFSMNAEVDTLELLGSFEQAERFRELDGIISEAILLLHANLRRQLVSSATRPLHTSITVLEQLSLSVAVVTTKFDIDDASSTVAEALRQVTAEDLVEQANALIARLEAATSSTVSTSARFEWVDGPLVQAMKTGEWLLIEDANLCSPSVLDRLNSLFETGGRLQLAERGPVNGEIQIIHPHPDFRLVMTLDPRHGELSRAMRNRGIEIAFLPPSSKSDLVDTSRVASSIRTPLLSPPSTTASSLIASSAVLLGDQQAQANISTGAFGADVFADASFSVAQEFLDLHLTAPALDRDALLRVLVATLPPSQHGLALRLTRTTALVERAGAEFALRRIGSHALTSEILRLKAGVADTRTVSSSLLALQPIDPALAPLITVTASGQASTLSLALDAITSLILCPRTRPEYLKTVASRPKKLLTTWETSVLASSGKLRLEDAEPALLALAPVSAALGRFVSDVASSQLMVASQEDQTVLAHAIVVIQSLASELEAVSLGDALDFSSIQHVASWIAKELDQLSDLAGELILEANQQLAPLKNSLELTSGKGMAQLWRAWLPFRPANPLLDAAYQRLMDRGRASAGELWEPALVSLFLDVATTLGVPQSAVGDLVNESAAQVVNSIVERLPAVTPVADDPTVRLTFVSNASSLVVAELAAVSEVFAASSFATGSTFSSHSAADLVRPALLQAAISLRNTDSSNLGNVVHLAESLKRAASLQALAASESQSRTKSLKAALLGAISLMVSVADEKEPIEATNLSVALLAPTRQLSPMLAEAVDLHLAKSLTELSHDESTLEAVGLGFIAFARCLWYIYVPNLPLDPAIGMRARSNYLARQIALLSATLAAFEANETQLTGNDLNAKIAVVRKELVAIQEEFDGAGGVAVDRDANPTLLSSLFLELRSFQNQIIHDSQLDSLINAITRSWTMETASRESNLQRSIETLLRRLSAAYAGLADVLAPIRLALCALKIGFSFVIHAARSATLPSDSVQFAVLLSHLTGFPTVAHAEPLHALDLPLSVKVGDGLLPPSRATLLQISALAKRLANNTAIEQGSLRRLTQLYDRMHYLWTADRRHEEEEAREAASLYRVKTDVQQIASDEELEAAEFAKLFPTFEEPLEDQVSRTGADATTSTKTHPRLLQPSDQATLADIHCDIFADAVRVADEPQRFERMRSAGVSTLLPPLFESLGEQLDRESAAYRVRTLVELGQMLTPSAAFEAHERDFYTEADVRETAKVVPIIQGLVARLESLIEQWPDQMVLQNLRDRCQTILSLSSQSPIAQVLTAIEQLLTQTEDWENYASREHSLVLNRTLITDLIVEWRRLELTCWSRLLSTVESRFGDPVAEWWFRFYEVTIRGAPGVDEDPEGELKQQTPAEYYRDLVSLLDTFFTSCSVGQYQARLRLVLSFANFAAKLGEDDQVMPGADSLRRVSQIMLNVHGFYDQFTPRVSSFLTSERAKIDKDVRNLIKLASWKDVNVYALRQSAIRSHHQLYKSVRKLRAVLQKPASDFFSLNEADRTLSPSIDVAPVVGTLPSTPIPSMPTELSSASVAPHLQRIEQTLARLTGLASAKLGPFLAFDRATSVDEFAVQIITTAKDLRGESLGPEEGREQRAKSLATRKRRAWIELLREIKRLGLSPSPAPDVVARLADSGVVYSLPSSRDLLALDHAILDPTRRDQLAKADDYHFRLLSEIPAIRATPASHHDDISTREVQRALGSIESCINFGFDHRAQLLSAIASHSRLSILIKRLEQVSTSPAAQPASTSRALAAALLETTSQVLQALAETEAEVASHRIALGALVSDVAVVDAAIRQATELLVGDRNRLLDILALMPSTEPVLATPAEFEAFELAHAHLTSVADGLAKFSCPPALRYLVEPVATWIASLELPSLAVSVAATPTGLEELNSAHQGLIDSVLVVAQEVQKLAVLPTTSPEDELEDLAIKRTASSLQETLRVFRLPEMLARVDDFVAKAHRLASSPASANVTSALLARVAPFLSSYSSLVDRHLFSFLEWHKASLKLAHILSSVLKELSADGFCRPSDDDGAGGEEGANGQTSDGTGMADGQGAKNVSNEIEEESQVEGLQGDVDKQEKQEEQEGDDDAVEMSMDFEGEMEDRGDGEKEEKEDGDEDSDDESQPDPEEQVADVDPLDPSSVDEKFWGDEDSKEEKNESNEQVNQETTKSAGESEMAAKEDESQAPQPKKPEAGEAASEEEQKEKEKAQEGAEANGETEEGEDGEAGEDDDEGREDEPAGEEEEGDAGPQADDGQKLDERMPEADNLDLPDDMQLDGEEKKEDDVDFGSDMGSIADPDEGDGGQADEIEEEDDSRDEQREDAEADVLPSNENDLSADAPEAAPEEAPALDESMGGADEGETGGEGSQDNASATKAEPAAPSDPSEQSGAQPEAKSNPAGEASADEPRDVPEASADDDAEEDEGLENKPSAPSNAADSQTKQRTSADPTSDASQPRPQKPSPQQTERSLGDALQSWRRRLEAIADMAEPETTVDELDSTAPGEENEVEFVPEGHEREEDGQALGPASEEQVQKLEQLRLEEDEEAREQGFEPDTMDVDDTTPTVPKPSTTTVNLNGSSLSEADAKAVHAAELQQDRSMAEQDQDDMDIERADEQEGLQSTTLKDSVEDVDDAAVEQSMLQWRAGEDDALTADGVWRMYETLTRDLSYALTEQLRLILEPTLATRLKGDYRSGKRLNMKKIIPYIASEFTKDKIWLRRTRPSQREYQILIAIDDSKSMADSHSVHLAFQSLALITRALTRLEVGGVSICRFGETMDVLHPFEAGAVSEDAGANLLGNFTFSQRTTDVRLLVEKSLAHLALAKNSATSKSSLAAGDLWQMQIIISDGMCQDHEKLRALLRRAVEQKVMFVFVVIDSLHRRTTDGDQPAASGAPAAINQNSILAMKSVSYTKGADGKMALKMDRYLDSFPFEYFVVLRDVEALPEVLGATLRQFFEKLDNQYEKYLSIRKERTTVRGMRANITLDGFRPAALEVLCELASFLSTRYPSVIAVNRRDYVSSDPSTYGDSLVGKEGGAVSKIENLITGDVFDFDKLDEDFCPMRIAGLLMQDDLAVMVEDESGEYRLQAASICTAGSWRLVDKMGTSLDQIHSRGGVPGWKDKLKPSMERYFTKMKADKAVERNNVDDQLPWAGANGPEDAFDEKLKGPDPSLLPYSEKPDWTPPTAITSSYMWPVTALSQEPGVPGRLASSFRAWSDDVHEYKGSAKYHDVLLAYLDGEHERQVDMASTFYRPTEHDAHYVKNGQVYWKSWTTPEAARQGIATLEFVEDYQWLIVGIVGALTIRNLYRYVCKRYRRYTLSLEKQGTLSPERLMKMETDAAIVTWSAVIDGWVFMPLKSKWWCGLENPLQVGLFLFTFAINTAFILAVDTNFHGSQDSVWNKLHVVALRNGFMALAQFPAIFALTGRNSVVQMLTGIEYQHLRFMHKLLACTMGVQGTIHTIHATLAHSVWLKGAGLKHLYTHYLGITGIIMLVGLSSIALFSIRRVRMKNYELFLIFHIIGAIMMLVGMRYRKFPLSYSTLRFICSPTWSPPDVPMLRKWVYAPIAFWLLERGLRILQLVSVQMLIRLKWRPPLIKANATLIEGAIVLRVPFKGKWYAGQHAYISIWDPSFIRTPHIYGQNHPFSIANVPGSSELDSLGRHEMMFVMRTRDGMTRMVEKRLKKSPNGALDLYVAVEGPYGGTIDTEQFQEVLLVAGGSGISHIMSMTSEIIHRARTNYTRVKRVKVIWTVQDVEQSIWSLTELLLGVKKAADAGIDFTVELYVTRGMLTRQVSRAESFDSMRKEKALPKVELVEVSEKDSRRASIADLDALMSNNPMANALAVIPGRPPLSGLVPAFVASAHGKSLVAACGPAPMSNKVREEVNKLINIYPVTVEVAIFE